MNIQSLIKEYLQEVMSLQIATSVGDTPWICTVCFASDEKYNLYWFSRHSAQHSKEIARNPHVAAAVAIPYALNDKPRGLQFAGKAEELRYESDIEVGLRVLQKRYEVSQETIEKRRQEILSGSADYGLYCLRPTTIILYDTDHFPDAPRKVYKIPR